MNKDEWNETKRKWLEAEFENPKSFELALRCLEEEKEFKPSEAWCEIQHL